MKIVMPGGSGQVGMVLERAFSAAGHEVVVLSRGAGQGPGSSRAVAWDGRTLCPWAAEVDGADVLINLAGRSVNARYGARVRREIMDSRVDSTRVLGEAIAVPGRLLEAGFAFRFPDWPRAASDLVAAWRAAEART